MDYKKEKINHIRYLYICSYKLFMLWQIIMAKQAGGPKRDQPAPADED